MFQMKFETDNDAFGPTALDRAEVVAQLLETAARQVRHGDVYEVVLDPNGNVVGKWRLNGRSPLD